MPKQKYFVLVYPTQADRKAGNYSHEFDCFTLAEAEEDADAEVTEYGNYAASIYERSGDTSPSVRIATHIQPQIPA